MTRNVIALLGYLIAFFALFLLYRQPDDIDHFGRNDREQGGFYDYEVGKEPVGE